MARQLSLATLLLVVLLSFCVSQVQAFSFDDLGDLGVKDSADEETKKKQKKICKIPGLEFLCKEDEEEPSNSADASNDGHRSLRA